MDSVAALDGRGLLFVPLALASMGTRGTPNASEWAGIYQDFQEIYGWFTAGKALGNVAKLYLQQEGSANLRMQTRDFLRWTILNRLHHFEALPF
jgi:hypothetical protein